MATHPDVLVIGGGIIGLTSAYFLAKSGLSVEVLDKGDLGREASWAGAGIIPPGDPDRAAAPIDKLRAIGSAKFPDLSAEFRERTGIDTGYRRCGGIEFLRQQDLDVLPLWEHEGIAFERVPLGHLRYQYEPAVGDVPGEPYLLPGCAQVRNPWHLRALIAACEQVGVRLRPRTPVEGWVRVRDRVDAVKLDAGVVSAGRFVLAAGAWSEGLLEPLGRSPGVHPVRGQIVLLNPGRSVLSRVLMLGKSYLVPREDGRVLVGSTEEPEAGFDNGTTASAVAALIGFATRTAPPLTDAAVEKAWAGLRPGSPDGMPFIGPVPGHENVLIAAGHFRAGVQLSVGTAELVRDLITGMTPNVPVEAFRLDRTPDLSVRPAFRS
jgi:glycine oxidase